MNNFGSLSTEIISRIVHHINQPQDLYTCALINQQWYMAANPLLWRTLTITDEPSFVNISTALATRGPSLGQHVRHLILAPSATMTDQQFLVLMKHMPQLATLKINSVKTITDNSVQHVARQCPHLTSVELISIPITKVSIIALGQHCRLLCNLALKYMTGLCPAIIPALLPCSRFLETLDISIAGHGNHPHESYHKRRVAATRALVSDLAQFTHLTTLALRTGEWSLSKVGARILQTPTSWPQLTRLSLSGCQEITTAQLASFLASHPGLTSLCLNDLPRSTDVLTPVGDHLPGIQSLSLGTHGRLYPQTICHFIHQCPSLTYLAFWDDYRLTLCKDDYPGVFDDDNNGELQWFNEGIFRQEVIHKIRALLPDPGQQQDESDHEYDSVDPNSSDEPDDNDESDDDWLP